LKFVDRVSSKPIKSEPDTGETPEPIASVQRENLQRLDDDIATFAKYLKTKGAPKAAIDVLEALRGEQWENWQKTFERIAALWRGEGQPLLST
jgi:hypothetical protein